MIIKSFIALFLLISAPMALAHGTGSSFEADVDGYLIDIGYNTEEFITGSQVLFDFGLETSSEYNIEYSDVWVRLIKDGKTVYASGVYNSGFGGARMTYTFPGEGEYELAVRYQKGSEKIVSASFPIKVSSGESEDGGASTINFASIILGILGLGVGYGAASFSKRK